MSGITPCAATPPSDLRSEPPQSVASSEGLGWPTGVSAECRRGLPSGRRAWPAAEHHRLTLLLGGCPTTRAAWRWGGHRRPAGAVLDRPGDPRLCLAPAGREQRWHWRGGRVDLFTVSLPPALLDSAAGHVAGTPARAELLDCLDCRDAALARLVDALRAELERPGPAGGVLAGLVIRAACVALVRRYCVVTRVPTSRFAPVPQGPPGHMTLPLTDREVARARGLMESCLGVRVPTVDEIAAAAGCRPGHFGERFRLATGLPPHAYLVRLRVDRALALLRLRPELSLAAAALEAGFSSQSHMTAQFTRHLGATPAAARRAAPEGAPKSAPGT